MLPSDRADLQRLAEAATPGPWKYLPPHAVGGKAIVPMTGPAVVPDAWLMTEPDAVYIAAVDPTAIRALLDRLAVAEARSTALEGALREIAEARPANPDWADRDELDRAQRIARALLAPPDEEAPNE